jgi:hypothetical protein
LVQQNLPIPRPQRWIEKYPNKGTNKIKTREKIEMKTEEVGKENEEGTGRDTIRKDGEKNMSANLLRS